MADDDTRWVLCARKLFRHCARLIAKSDYTGKKAKIIIFTRGTLLRPGIFLPAVTTARSFTFLPCAGFIARPSDPFDPAGSLESAD